MRRSSINALMMESRRNSIESTFVSGSHMDSHSRKTCMMALRTLTTLLSCPGLDPRQISFSASISTVLRFATLHQNKTVELGILALSCLNGLVARPGYLATNQEALTSSVRIMADLIRYFNEVKDGIDDIDESYLQMFMHFVSLFCTWTHLERAEKALGVSIPDFLASFSRFTLEKVSVDYLKVCMDVWKSLLDALIQGASDLDRPIPAQHPLRRVQGAVLAFMSELVDKFYKMKGALRSEDAFTTFEVEDEEDLGDLTELVQSFVGLVGELFTEEVIEMLNPLLTQQLELYSRRELDECKTLPVTLGILSRVAYNFLQDFERRREYTSNLIIHLTRMTKLSMEYYLAAISDASNFGKDGPDLTGTTTLALFDCLIPLIPWLNHLWKFETDPTMHNNAQAMTPIARDIYQEMAQICSDLFRKLLPMSSSKGLPEQSLIPSSTMDTFLGPVSGSCSALDRKLLLASVRTLSVLTLHVRIPASLLTAHSFSFWGLDSIRELASSLSQNLMTNSNFMGTEFVPSETTVASEDEERKGITPNDELFCLAYVALSNGIALDPKASQDHQAYGNLVAPAIYPLQNILQESRTSQGNFMDSSEVKFRIHRSLTVLRALINSVTEASVASRIVVYEGLKSALPLVHEYFEIYAENHALVKSLYRQVGEGHCMELARVLMERLTSPPLLESALSQTHQHHQQSLHQRSFVLQQQKAVERIHLSLSVLKAILELPGKDVTLILSEFLQFLLIQLGPKLVGAQHQQLNNGSSKPTGSLGTYQETNQGMQEEGLDANVNDLLALFYTTIQTLLTHHCRFFFVNARAIPAAGGQDVNDHDSQRAQALQKCMEFLAHGLHCPEPDLVRRTIEILSSLQDHNLCRLFERSEFQLNFRFEFLQILLRLALGHQQDLLLEEIAGLIHKMVKGDRDGDEKFLSVWNGDLKRFVAALEPHHVLATASSVSTSAAAVSSTGSPQPGQPGDSPSPRAVMLSNARYSDAMKEALWMDIAQLGDSSTYREGLYDFVNDAQVYAQSLIA
ncbi:Exportin-6 [Mortierella polycephala]|uniref:Exportin-6 n=1 Tax=Mortierella polycephala TaxID=41804 RepID=A0A9P6U3T7_9FUNG|nr:Exportin-6 [Mortierella polycephala]